VSLGPTLCSPHTTSERCNIPSVAEFYKFIRKVIEDIPAK
jgi:dipeptidase D